MSTIKTRVTVKRSTKGINELLGEGVNWTVRRIVEVEKEAKLMAPRRSGRLRDSIEVQKTQDGAKVGSPLPYAGVIEKRSPYLKPALDKVVNKYQKRD